MFKNITLYGLTHALVDAACAAVVFSIPVSGKFDAASVSILIVLYDVLAFALQPVAGFAADWSKSPRKAAAAGCLLVACAALLIKWPGAAVCLAGVGNALFHVGGGIICLNLKPKSAGPAGAYVAPGAMGLFVGTLIGKGGHFASWIFVLALVCAALCIIKTKHPGIEYDKRGYESQGYFGIILILLLASVAVRALVGLALDFPWKSDVALLTGLTASVVMGKAIGGILADRLGWIRTSIMGLIISAPLLSFGGGNPCIAMVGVFLFNLTMPVTLIAVSNMFPGYTGFAFGLTALGLIAGSLPAFTVLKPIIGGDYVVFVIILVSALMLYKGLKLYFRGETMEGKNTGKMLKFMAVILVCMLLPSVNAYAADVASPALLVIGLGTLIIFGLIIVVVIVVCIKLIKWIIRKNANK